VARSAHRWCALGTVLAAVLAAGCGGSERPAITDALRLDARTYLFYSAPIWWGRPVETRVVSLRRDGDRAVAELVAPPGRQRVVLERVDGDWTVLTVSGATRSEVTGPAAFRTAVGPERAEIATAFEEDHKACEPVTAHVSRIDGRYASATGGPACGEGVSLLLREHGRWTLVSYPSRVFACRAGPPGVMRSLFGRCVIG
jgi:hypothetical protein